MDGIMKQIFNSNGFKYAILILSSMAIIKFIWVIVASNIFPSNTIEIDSPDEVKALYYRVSLAKQTNTIINKPKVIITKPVQKQSSMKGIRLIGIYIDDENIIVTIEKLSKRVVLSKGEEFKGFKLISATKYHAIFSKGNREYKLEFIKNKETKTSDSTSIVKEVEDIPKVKSRTQKKDDIIDDGYTKTIKRDFLNSYMKNPKDIWKDIGINEIKDGKSITGFRVRFVRKDSGFDKLGIKRGDIILGINGEKLTSHKSAFNAYKNIKTIENLTLTVKRNNQEMELEYEIK